MLEDYLMRSEKNWYVLGPRITFRNMMISGTTWKSKPLGRCVYGIQGYLGRMAGLCYGSSQQEQRHMLVVIPVCVQICGFLSSEPDGQGC